MDTENEIERIPDPDAEALPEWYGDTREDGMPYLTYDALAPPVDRHKRATTAEESYLRVLRKHSKNRSDFGNRSE